MLDIDPNIDPALFLVSSPPPPPPSDPAPPAAAASAPLTSSTPTTTPAQPATDDAAVNTTTTTTNVLDSSTSSIAVSPAVTAPPKAQSPAAPVTNHHQPTATAFPNGFAKSPDIAVPSHLPEINGAGINGEGNVTHSEQSTSTSIPPEQASTTQARLSQSASSTPAPAPAKRKHEEPAPFTKCPYRERRNCKKEYKHKNTMRYHLEQAHSQEPDIAQRLADFPAQPPSKKTKTSHAKSASSSNNTASNASNNANSNPNNNNNNNSSSNNRSQQLHQSQRQPSHPTPPLPAPNPYFGLFTHGYVFSSAGLPFRPHDRPIDALYYLNILSTAGIKSQQQRASERLMVNALLNADFVRGLQQSVNMQQQLGHIVHPLDLLDNLSMLKRPDRPVQPSAQFGLSPYTKRDADSAILKLAKTLQDVGLGDSIDNAHYF